MIWLDIETYNDDPISNGTYQYTAGCEVMVVAYALDAGVVRVWDRTTSPAMPASLEMLLEDEEELITAHSSMFDRNGLKYGLGVDIPIHRWRDTMVQALSHSLPGGLDKLCDILGVPEDQAKLKDGRALIHLFCKPRPQNSVVRRATHATHPEEWQCFLRYAASDVAAMRSVAGKLPVWNYQGAELALWHLDQKINDRGLCADTALAAAAIKAVAKEQVRLAHEVQAATGYDAATGEGVASATQRDKLLAHILQYHGIALPDMQMATLERRISDPDLPVELRELLALRLQSTTTSTSKYKALMRGVSADGRLRGLAQFNGASRTGRWGHRMFQPGNMPRPNLPPAEIDYGIEAMLLDAADLACDDVMRAASNAIRGCIIAPAGRKLVVSDLANIEGRVAAWLAGEDWKLDAFRRYDAGTGPDLYLLTFAKTFALDPATLTKEDPGRQIGKVEELLLQYQGGVGAFITGAATYGIDLDAMTEVAYPTLPADVVEEAQGFYDWSVKKKRDTFGLPAKVFVTCDGIKRRWRKENPAIVNYWSQLHNAILSAIHHPGTTFPCKMLKVRRDGAWLRIVLPSGRALHYPSPHADGSGQVSYKGMHHYTRQWQRLRSYPGKFFENVCQAVARDFLAYSMQPAEDAGYAVVTTIHDELITEAPDSARYSHTRLSAILSHAPAWGYGIPLAADGFEAQRYRKK